MNHTDVERFMFINHHDPIENDQPQSFKLKNSFGSFDPTLHHNVNLSNLKMDLHEKQLSHISKSKTKSIDPQEEQKDKKIKKLTKINKHLLQKLKEFNDLLTKKVEKQKFRIPKKPNSKFLSKNQESSKQVESIKKQLQNAYDKINFYKETISLLKAKQLPKSEQYKLTDQNERLRQKNDDIERIQHEIQLQKSIKIHQEKQLSKVKNKDTTEILQKLDEQIINAKTKLREMKKTLNKKEEIQKKQHFYFRQLESLIKMSKNNQDQNLQSVSLNYGQKSEFIDSLISEAQWKETKKKLFQQRRKYEENGKKLTYYNYMKSKLSKNYDETQLKFKEKQKILQKLNSKLNEVNKLVRVNPKVQTPNKINLKMQKLKDIIDRQSSIEMKITNKIKSRANSEDVRQFKKWQIQHLTQENNKFEQQQNVSRIKINPSSQLSTPFKNEIDIILGEQKDLLLEA